LASLSHEIGGRHCDWSRGPVLGSATTSSANFLRRKLLLPFKESKQTSSPSKLHHPWRRILPLPIRSNVPSRYTQVAAPNSAKEASVPVPQTIIPNESFSSDAASYSTGLSTNGLGESGSSQSGPEGVHVINRNELSALNTNDEEQVIHEPGPSITLNAPIVHDETGDADEEKSANGYTSFKDKMKKKSKKFSKDDVQVIGFGSLGLVNVLAMAGVGYWGYKKYGGGLKIVGIIVGACVGISALEIAGLRYRPNSLIKSNLFSSAFKVWRERKDKAS